jgi:predicted HNH restriction endonuclease
MKKLPHTPNSRIRSALRQLWLRSRERAATLKRDKYCCQDCGQKQSKAVGKEFQVQVHHKGGVLNWEELITQVRHYLLCNPDKLITLCKNCHDMREMLGDKDETI